MAKLEYTIVEEVPKATRTNVKSKYEEMLNEINEMEADSVLIEKGSQFAPTIKRNIEKLKLNLEVTTRGDDMYIFKPKEEENEEEDKKKNENKKGSD